MFPTIIYRQNRVIRFIALAALFLINASLYIAIKIPTVTGYEISIYAAYPVYFWIFLILSLSAGIYIVIYQTTEDADYRLGLIGILIIIISNMTVLLLPIFRGYFFNDKSDGLIHLGMIQDIYLTGKIGIHNFYPISHILAIAIHFITGLNIKTVAMLLPSLFYLLYVTGMFLVAKTITKNRGEVLLISVLATILLISFYNSTFTPFTLSLAIVPIILFLYQRRLVSEHKLLEHKVLLIMLLLLIPFFHIFNALSLAVTFAVFETSSIIYFKFIKQANTCLKKITPFISYSLPAIAFITSFLWYSGFAQFRGNIRQIYNWFAYGIGETPAGIMQQQWERLGWGIKDTLLYAFNTGFNQWSFILLALISVALLLRKIYLKRNPLRIEEFYFSFIFLLFLFGQFLSSIFSLPTKGEPRYSAWFLIAATILNGMLLYNWLSGSRLKNLTLKGSLIIKLLPYFLTIIITIIATVGIFNVHSSPIVKVANQQCTYENQKGILWLLKQADDGAVIFCNDAALPWILCPILGLESSKPVKPFTFLQLPGHFGYDINANIASALGPGSYMVLDERTRAIYRELWPKIGRLTANDFEGLNSDHTAIKLYGNSGIEIWRMTTNREVGN